MSRDTDETGHPPAEQDDTSDLLPGWSSLVILLTLFGLISVVTLLAVVRDGEVYVTPDSGGTRAYGPGDFPEIRFDEPLLPAVLEAAASGGESPVAFNVPPPPFSDEEIFPCTGCHEDLEVDPEPRVLEYFHEEIELNHGPEERWCLDCHDADDRDYLRLVSGELVGFDKSYRLCGQCHGTIYRDWREGIHGRRRGFWNGPKSYLLCAHCHDPHAPAFKPIEPLPPPVRPQFLRGGIATDGAGETHEQETGH